MTPLPEGIHPESLTEALRRSGVLGTGRVRDAQVQDARKTLLSEITRLRLEYEDGGDEAPATLICKTGQRPEGATWNGGRHEVAFYANVAPQTPAGLLPRCFDAAASPDGASWHLLLEDLAGTHEIATTWPLPPEMPVATRIVEARARFHAAWWDHPALGNSVGEWPKQEDLPAMLARFEEKLARFIARAGDLLTSERLHVYQRLVACAPHLNARYYARRNLTLVHGDGHFWNCFLAKSGEGVKFFDWDCWRVDAGTDDLAYMIAMHWYPERRRRFERALLDRYHETLLAHGVSGYDRNALEEDYRFSVLWQITTPVWQAGIDLPPLIWWNNFERIMLAVDDLGCRQLLD